MQKLSDLIFKRSPKNLAIYLVLAPILLCLLHTIVTIGHRFITKNTTTQETLDFGISGVLFLFLGVFLLVWFSWLRDTVYSVQEKQLGLAKKWFQIAYAFLWFFVLFNAVAIIVEDIMASANWNDEHLYLINASREFINFGGIIIAYPIVCHYAARAIYAKQYDKTATLVKALTITVLLVFGTVLGVPFLHKHFSAESSTTTEIAIIYAIALGLCFVLFIIGFIAAITGMI